MNKLADRAVLMRFSAGLPGQHRKDKKTTSEVKMQKGLGSKAGNWITDLWPEGAMDAIKQKQGEARAYHDTVTFPFGCRSDDDDSGGTPAIAGIGILPAALIAEYGDKMRLFRGEMEKLVQEFLVNPRQWVDWAVREHNGTFEPKNYPGCSLDGAGAIVFDDAEFRKGMAKKFYLRSEPLPVPDKEQFSANVMSLLGQDVESVDNRIKDSTVEAQRELMRRMIQPVTHMAYRLAEQPCPCRDCKGAKGKTAGFKDSLIDNVTAIVGLAPKLNIMGDSAIDGFVSEMEALTRYAPEALRKDDGLRAEAAAKAQATLQRLSGYKL